MGKFYAVHKGRKPGTYTSWPDCQAQIQKFKGCSYKSFSTRAEAESFVRSGTVANSVQNVKPPKTAKNTKNSDDIDTDTLLEIFGDESDDIFDDEECVATNGDATKNISAERKRKITQKQGLAKKFRGTGPKMVEPHSNAPSPSKSVEINSMIFTSDSHSRPVVFADGACSNNGKKKQSVKAGYGVCWGENHPLNLSCRLQGIQTNQRAEIAAVNACLEQAIDNGIKTLTIKTDSMFIINCITKWVPGWLRKNWIKADGKPVIHKEEFLVMLSRLEKVKVNWEHVRGHRGIHGNEMADRLAVKGAML